MSVSLELVGSVVVRDLILVGGVVVEGLWVELVVHLAERAGQTTTGGQTLCHGPVAPQLVLARHSVPQHHAHNQKYQPDYRRNRLGKGGVQNLPEAGNVFAVVLFLQLEHGCPDSSADAECEPLDEDEGDGGVGQVLHAQLESYFVRGDIGVEAGDEAPGAILHTAKQAVSPLLATHVFHFLFSSSQMLCAVFTQFD